MHDIRHASLEIAADLPLARIFAGDDLPAACVVSDGEVRCLLDRHARPQ